MAPRIAAILKSKEEKKKTTGGGSKGKEELRKRCREGVGFPRTQIKTPVKDGHQGHPDQGSHGPSVAKKVGRGSHGGKQEVYPAFVKETRGKGVDRGEVERGRSKKKFRRLRSEWKSEGKRKGVKSSFRLVGVTKSGGGRLPMGPSHRQIHRRKGRRR